MTKTKSAMDVVASKLFTSLTLNCQTIYTQSSQPSRQLTPMQTPKLLTTNINNNCVTTNNAIYQNKAQHTISHNPHLAAYIHSLFFANRTVSIK